MKSEHPVIYLCRQSGFDEDDTAKVREIKYVYYVPELTNQKPVRSIKTKYWTKFNGSLGPVELYEKLTPKNMHLKPGEGPIRIVLVLASELPK